jgi:hypothetical protein
MRSARYLTRASLRRTAALFRGGSHFRASYRSSRARTAAAAAISPRTTRTSCQRAQRASSLAVSSSESSSLPNLRFAGSFTVTVIPTTPTAPTAATALARASSPFTSRAAVAPTEAVADAAPRGSIRARIRPAWVANQVRNSAGGAPRQNGSRTMRRNSMAPARRLVSAALIDASGRSTTQDESNHKARGVAPRHVASGPAGSRHCFRPRSIETCLDTAGDRVAP